MTDKSTRNGLRGFGLALGAMGIAAYRARDTSRAHHGANDDAAPSQRAATPAALPAPGLKAVLMRTFRQISADHVLLVAAGVTFYAILALFPALAALVSIYGLFADPATIQGHLSALEGVLPGGAVSIIGSQLESLVSQGSTGLGLAFFVGLAASLWSANAGVKSIFEALNIAYEETETRSFVTLTLTAFMFTLGGLLLVILALGAVLVVPALLSFLSLGGTVELLINWLRWPVLFVLVAMVITLLYRFGPSRQPASWRWLSWGSGLAALLWLAFSGLFSWYAANFGSYDATYGSLGAAIGFMTWIWISTILVITGAELNSELERETSIDTTTGPEKPMGARGAVMADQATGGPDRSGGRHDGL